MKCHEKILELQRQINIIYCPDLNIIRKNLGYLLYNVKCQAKFGKKNSLHEQLKTEVQNEWFKVSMIYKIK